MPDRGTSVERSGTKKADLVLEGGGVKGIGLLGALATLADRGYTFPRIAGTSAGAIVGALAASYVATGNSLADLVPIMRSVNYDDFRDKTALDHFGPIGRAAQLLIGRGIYKGDFLVSWLSKELAKVNVETFGDLRISDADDPASSLPPEQRYRLVVMASDISKGQLVRLPWDYARYGVDPDKVRIAHAVRASMSIPFFFRPATLVCGDKTKVTLVDGGMLSNFPIECFDRTDGEPPRWPTFGVKLSARPGAQQRPRNADSTIELGIACLQTLLAQHDNYHLDDAHVTERTIFVDTLGVSATDFGIDRDVQAKLFANGQGAAEAFLRTWPPAQLTASGASRVS
jgi:NTE family protein